MLAQQKEKQNMDDYGETGQVGCFVDLIFIIIAIVIAYCAFNTYEDKTQYIVLILVICFIRKVIMDYIPKN